MFVFSTSASDVTYWNPTHVRHFGASRLRATTPGAVQVLKWEKAFHSHSSADVPLPKQASTEPPACGVSPPHSPRRPFAGTMPPHTSAPTKLREFNEPQVWSAAASMNVSCAFVCHEKSQTPTSRPGGELHPDLDYVFDQCKHMEEMKEWAYGDATGNESLLC